MQLPPLLLTIFISIPVDSKQRLTSFERDVLPRRALFLSAHQKFSRDLNLYARKWRLLRGFDRKLFPRILSGVQIIPFSPLSCFFYKFKILLRKSDTRLSNCFGYDNNYSLLVVQLSRCTRTNNRRIWN